MQLGPSSEKKPIEDSFMQEARTLLKRARQFAGDHKGPLCAATAAAGISTAVLAPFTSPWFFVPVAVGAATFGGLLNDELHDKEGMIFTTLMGLLVTTMAFSTSTRTFDIVSGNKALNESVKVVAEERINASQWELNQPFTVQVNKVDARCEITKIVETSDTSPQGTEVGTYVVGKATFPSVDFITGKQVADEVEFKSETRPGPYNTTYTIPGLNAGQ